MASPRNAVQYAGSGTQLLTRREANEFAGDDFTRPTRRPIGSTTFLGRRAWTVELAPPAHKPYPLQLVVDAETGVVLQQRNDDFGAVDEWVEFVAGESFDPNLFRWDGPTRPPQDWEHLRKAEHEADGARRRTWFTGNVAPLPLRVELDLTVWVHEYDDDGAFQASVGADPIGMLARRPRSTDPWDLGWSDTQHTWSTQRWDWALSIVSDGGLTPSGLDALKRQLGSN